MRYHTPIYSKMGNVIMATDSIEAKSPLGKAVNHQPNYDPALLFPIARQTARDLVDISTPLPFHGVDIWNAYEVSWLNKQGKPCVAIATITVPCTSPNIFESKSLKLYLNSLNSQQYEDVKQVKTVIEKDLTHVAGEAVSVDLKSVDDFADNSIGHLPGTCLDHLDITTDCYQPNKTFLQTRAGSVSEELYSNLLRSNCLITNQPDWASFYIAYTGQPIDHAGLLQYIISMRLHNEFHEPCVEHVFVDIMSQCKPEALTVYARYTRRGGIDINPYRSTNPNFTINNQRLARQ